MGWDPINNTVGHTEQVGPTLFGVYQLPQKYGVILDREVEHVIKALNIAYHSKEENSLIFRNWSILYFISSKLTQISSSVMPLEGLPLSQFWCNLSFFEIDCHLGELVFQLANGELCSLGLELGLLVQPSWMVENTFFFPLSVKDYLLTIVSSYYSPLEE